MLRKGFIPALFLLILFAGIASAAPDFTAYSESVSSVCGCSVSEQRVFFRNYGDSSRAFFLSPGGEASGFISVYPSSFILGPGEESVVSEFISAPCGSDGVYPLSLEIRTNYNELKVLKQSVRVSGCRNMDVYVAAANNSGCRCSTLSYGLVINNTGSYSDTFSFSVAGLPSDYAYVIPEKADLASGETGLVSVFATPACDAKPGSFDLIVNGERSRFSEKVRLAMMINASCSGNVSALKRDSGSGAVKYLSDSLLYFPAVLAILLVVVAVFRLSSKKEASMLIDRKRPSAADSGRQYRWAKRFPLKDEAEQGREDWNLVSIILLILAAMIAVSAVFMMVFGPVAVGINQSSSNYSRNNYSINDSLNFFSFLYRNDSANAGVVAPPPAAPAAPSQNASPSGPGLNISGSLKGFFSLFSLNKSSSNLSITSSPGNLSSSPASGAFSMARSFIVDYYAYFLAGFVILAVIIFILELSERMKKKE